VIEGPSKAGGCAPWSASGVCESFGMSVSMRG
jgi:hypothetical protein